jgi:UDP-N-acetylglucosamine--N-acetylmuramyl-(pentapeptide) pyrophosphoryl-undecaprenol N-acetylglucosamine transferase
MSQPRIVIAAGGTAGHVVPALAVADSLRHQGAAVAFIGGERAEATLVPAAGYRFEQIRVEGLDRRNPLRAARALARAVIATLRARRLLAALAPDAVLGAGGYVAGPVALAARSLGAPLVLTEADSHLGITNRLLAPMARRVCLAFPLPGRNGDRYRVTGRPVPPGDFDRDAARAKLGIAPGETCVLVFGGSLGARSINEAAVEAFAGASFRVVHITGTRDYEQLVKRVPGPHYTLFEYLAVAEFGAALAASDLIVARAGGSVFEIAAHGRPAVLVPYPHAAADHQSANAAWMARAGAALVIPDGELTAARLAHEIATLLADRSRLAAMARAAESLARPDAAGAVAAELLAAAQR